MPSSEGSKNACIFAGGLNTSPKHKPQQKNTTNTNISLILSPKLLHNKNTTTMPTDIISLLQKAIANNDTFLDLGNCGLTDDNFPTDFFTYTVPNITKLNLGAWYLDNEQQQKYCINNNTPNNLSGDFILKIANIFPALIDLAITNTSLGSKGVKALTKLSQLRYLILNNNDVNEEDSIEVVKEIVHLDKLIFLMFRANKINNEGLKIITSLSRLKYLNIAIGKINIEGAKNLSSLTQLTNLDISSNQIGAEGAKVLSSLTQLTNLDISGNQIGAEGAKVLSSLTQLTNLDISNNQIGDKGAKAFSSLTQLTDLSIDDNQIGDKGAKALSSLTQLTNLSIDDNQIGDKGAKALSSLTQLTNLRIRDNQIGDEGAKALSSLTQLTNLEISSNQIGDVGAKALSSLTQLTNLYIWNNQIGDEGAKAISSVTQLTNLDISTNQIGAEGAKAISSLTQLIYLSIGNNQIGDEGTKALSNLSQLTTLDIQNNNIQDIKPLQKLSLLRYLRLYSNPLQNAALQAAIEENQSYENCLDIARNYWEANDEEIPLQEVKVLILGTGGAGKTTFRKRLMDEKCKVPDKKQPSTHGIQIHRHTCTDTQGNTIQLNLWDFGGQEIQYFTHQFFLTPEALYILICDDRRQDTDFDYWFKVSDLLGNRHRFGQIERSPIMVVLNKHNITGASFDYDENNYKETYPQILPVQEVDFSEKDQRWEALLTQIHKKAKELPIFKQTIYKKWQKVRESLFKARKKSMRSGEEPYISDREFYKLCEKADIKTEKQQVFLLDMLSALGDVIYFKQHAPDRVFINPQWVADAIYTVLSKDKLREDKGKFTREWIETKWTEKGIKDKRDHQVLLELMQKHGLKLCYETHTPGTFLYPKALPATQPKYTWKDEDNLHLRFLYSFIPEGLMASMIVQCHEILQKDDTGKDIVWEKGAVFHYKNTNGEIRQMETKERGERVFYIRTEGAEAKDLLNYLRVQLETKVHAPFGNLNAIPQVPCECKGNGNIRQAYFFDEKVLRDFQTAGTYEATCYKQGCGKKCQISKMLDVAMSEGEREKMRQMEQQIEQEAERLKQEAERIKNLERAIQLGEIHAEKLDNLTSHLKIFRLDILEQFNQLHISQSEIKEILDYNTSQWYFVKVAISALSQEQYLANEKLNTDILAAMQKIDVLRNIAIQTAAKEDLPVSAKLKLNIPFLPILLQGLGLTIPTDPQGKPEWEGGIEFEADLVKLTQIAGETLSGFLQFIRLKLKQ